MKRHITTIPYNPVQTPWHPPPEKNIEEVFRRYQYVAIVYSDAGRKLAVSRYLKGQLADTTYWTRQADGSLQAVGQTAAGAARVASRSLYLEHCAACHGADRLGGAGPALLPANPGRLKQAAAADVIKNGRIATQMPPFGSQLSEAGIQQLVELVYSMPAEPPVWDSDGIDASRAVLHAEGSLPGGKVFNPGLGYTWPVAGGSIKITNKEISHVIQDNCVCSCIFHAVVVTGPGRRGPGRERFDRGVSTECYGRSYPGLS